MQIVFISFCIFVSLKFNGGASAENSSEVFRRTLPAYTVTIESEILNKSSVCRKELEIFRTAIGEGKLWSVKMLDASGEPRPGFTYGQNHWLGVRTQCLDLGILDPLEVSPEAQKNISKYRNVNEEYPPFEVNYFAAHFRHNSTFQYHEGVSVEDVITLGLCLPAICNTEELSLILKKIFKERTLAVSGLYKADYELLDVKDLKDNQEYLMNWHFIATGLIILSTLIMVILGTVYDLTVHQKRLKTNKLFRTDGNCVVSTLGAKMGVESGGDSVVPTVEDKPGFLGNVILCFSVYSNSKIIFNTNTKSDSIQVIHGLRFVSMFWIIMLHSILYTRDYIDNSTMAWKLSHGVLAQLIANGTFSVDTFFFLSGFLAAYIFYASEAKRKDLGRQPTKFSLSQFISTLLKRFARLTPAYIMTMLILETVYSRFDRVSQFYMSERPQHTCSKYLWRNVLYINNLFSRSEMCASWSWYLSNDMQFHIIGSVLVVCSMTYFYTCSFIWVILLVAATLASGYVSYTIGYTPTMDMQWNTLNSMYDPPWMRIGPFLIGIAAAYIFVRNKQKWTAKKSTVCIFWILGAMCNLGVIFILYDRNISVFYTAIYSAFSRTLWGLGIAWIIFACSTDHGGFLNTFLSCKIWTPFSKLTYCAYLLNPMIFNVIHLGADASMHVDLVPNFVIFFGSWVATYTCAYLLSLMFETPFLLLVKVFTAKPRRK